MKPLNRFTKKSCIIVSVLLLCLLAGACGQGTDPIPSPTIAVVLPPSATPALPTNPPASTDVPLPTTTPTASQTPDLIATQVEVARAAAATLTAEAKTAAITSPDTPTVAASSTLKAADTSTPESTDTPIPEPTDSPTSEPTDTPTSEPTEPPTPKPTKAPVPTPKPQAGKILFTSNRASWDDVFVMKDDGTDIKQLTRMGRCYDAHFAPNGKAVVFSHIDGDNLDVWKMNADGSGLTNLTNTTDNIEDYPVVAPDGTRIAYLFAWLGGFEIYTMKLDGSDRKPVTSREFDLTPAWSPDSQKIAFSSLRGGGWNIWVVNRDGSDVRQVTQYGPERIAQSPVFSPDGNQIAFTTIAAGTSWEIWVVNLDGSNPHKVVGTVGTDPNNSTYIAAWHQGKFLIGGYQGRWDPYFVAEGGGEPSRVISGENDDKPSDWWLP